MKRSEMLKHLEGILSRNLVVNSSEVAEAVLYTCEHCGMLPPKGIYKFADGSEFKYENIWEDEYE